MGEPGRLPIGVALGTLGVDAAWWLESARRLDDAGYRAIWAWDVLVSQGATKTTPVLEAWTVLSAAAATTRRAFIGSFVLNVMSRHPAVLARAAATLQQVAGGRLRLGIGIGGSEREHAAFGIDFPAPAERAEHLREAIGVLRALWTGGPVDLPGPRYPLAGAWAHPVPDPPPPILVGAQSPAGVRLAAELADGWAAEEPFVDRLLPQYLEALEANGRRREDQAIVVGFPGGRAGVPALVGNPFLEAPAERVADWRERGVDELILTARTTQDVDALVAAADRW